MKKYIDADALIMKLADYALQESPNDNDPADIRMMDKAVYDAINECAKTVEEMPAADVEPVRKWTSVNERLPEEFRDVLVWYGYNGLYWTYGVGYHSGGTWVGKFNGKNQKVIAWMHFPEPPKMDGGSEE